METEPTFEQHRMIQNEQQFYDALAVVDFLLHTHDRDQESALKAAQAEDDRRAGKIGCSDGGFWREVIRILKQPEMTWDEMWAPRH